MQKTILLVFIHGFKGDDDTFSTFPEKLRALTSRALPSVRVRTAVYPKYDTKGELQECVTKLHSWLQNTVIDLEVANHTRSPMMNASVHVFLIGHSMGGILAADLLLDLAAERPFVNLPSGDWSDSPGNVDLLDPPLAPPMEQPLFPHIRGVLAFDTPFLGIAPGVFSYGAEGQYQKATAAYNTASQALGMFGIGKKKTTPGAAKDPPNPPPSNVDAAAIDPMQTFGRYAMYLGAAGAMVGAGGALWSQRQNISAGVDWVSSHLVFVGSLARGTELQKRVVGLADVQKKKGVQCTNFYTCLGSGASALRETRDDEKLSWSERIIRSKNRTFCTIPDEVETEDTATSEQPGLQWTKVINHKAGDEVTAHISMFRAKENPALIELVGDACKAIVTSIDQPWYESSVNLDEEKDDLMDEDDVVIVDRNE